jgi:hypothetical protein
MEPTKEAKKKYRLKPSVIWELGPTHITQINEVPVSLSGDDVKAHRPASSRGPAMDYVVKGATQAQLKKLFDEGNPLIEETDE